MVSLILIGREETLSRRPNLHHMQPNKYRTARKIPRFKEVMPPEVSQEKVGASTIVQLVKPWSSS